MNEITRQLGAANICTVRYWIIKHGIPIRSAIEAAQRLHLSRSDSRRRGMRNRQMVTAGYAEGGRVITSPESAFQPRGAHTGRR